MPSSTRCRRQRCAPRWSAAASRNRGRRGCTRPRARGSGSTIAYRLIDFDALGLPECGASALCCELAAQHGLRRPQRHASVQAAHHRAVSTSSRRRRGDRRGQHGRVPRGQGRSGTTPIAGALPRASARGCAGARPRPRRCFSAPAARARRSRARSPISAPSSLAIFDHRCGEGGRASRQRAMPRSGRDARRRSPRRSRSRARQADGLVNTTPVGMAKYPGMPVAAPMRCGRTSGSPTSSTFPPRPSCFAPPRRPAAARCRDAAWPSSRR